LLAGERGHYELASKRDPKPLIQSLEGFATPTELLPEQVWDEADRPDQHLHLGRPTGAAVPLLWAHAEYIKLLRSVRDGRVFDCIPEVERRYQTKRGEYSYRQFWSLLYPSQKIERGHTLRIIAEHPFRLLWSGDGWARQADTDSVATNLGVAYADVATGHDWPGPLAFTFFWTESQTWESRDFKVELVDASRS
jgi:glucoamylase